MSSRSVSVEGGDEAPKKKRARLSCSCQRCRQKKIKCDERVPRCTQCEAAGAECVVTKPSDKSYVEPIRRPTGLAMPVRKRKQLEKAAMKQTPKRSADDAPIASTGTSYSAYGHSIPISDAEALLQMHRSFEQQPHERISDVHPRVNDVGLVHTQDAERRKFAGASSSSIFLKWLDSESTGSHLTKHLRYGVTTSETYTFPGMLPSTPTLPKPEWTQAFLQRYFVTIHSMIPFVDEQTMRNLAASPDPSKEDPLSLVLLELVLSHGALTGDIVEGYAQESERLFQHAWTAIPAVLASPFRLSVQILGLICLGLRSRNRDGAAWNFAGIAVRLAQSLGLHHQAPGPTAQMDARIWFCTYALDKMLAFECGRPTAITDNDCTTELGDCGPPILVVVPDYPPLNLFECFISICQELSHISSSLFKRGATKLSTVEALRRIGEADARLLKCVESWPIDLRPNMDGQATADWLLPFAARIHSIFFLALITLHRLSLFDEGTVVTPHLDHPDLKPYASRLRTSGAVCSSAARAMLTLLERLSQTHPADRSWSASSVLTAIYVLSIRTYKMPSTWQAAADLMFLKKACEFAATRYRDLGFDERFIALLPKLYQKIEDKVMKPNQPSRPPTRPTTPAPVDANHPEGDEAAEANRQALAEAATMANGWAAATTPAGDQSMIDPQVLQQDGANSNLFDFGELSDYWPTMLLGDGSQWNNSFVFDETSPLEDILGFPSS